MQVVASLAGATRTPVSLGVPTRIGGFGGREGFTAYLKRERIGAVLDATHPFAAAMSHRTLDVCTEEGIPYAQVLRPAWRPAEGDTWTFLNNEADAARHVPPHATVFLATGRQSLPLFAPISDRTLFARRIDPPGEPFPFPHGGWVLGRPPFSVGAEEALFHRLGIDWLVVKNAGGSSSRAKLDAARNLGIPVAMIRRPLQPQGIRLETVAAALTWVRRLG